MSDKREEIIQTLKQVFVDLNSKNLPIFGVPNKTLTDFTTTEKDHKRGRSRYPPKQFRLLEEDIIDEDAKGQPQDQIKQDEAFECVIDDLKGNLELRGQQYAESKQTQEYEDEEEDEDQFQVPDPSKEPTTRMVSIN